MITVRTRAFRTTYLQSTRIVGIVSRLGSRFSHLVMCRKQPKGPMNFRLFIQGEVSLSSYRATTMQNDTVAFIQHLECCVTYSSEENTWY